MVNSTQITYIVLGLTLLAMVWYITNQGRANMARAKAESEPAVAGDDMMEGSAKNPEQFDVPDDDALDEMAKLLGEDENE